MVILNQFLKIGFTTERIDQRDIGAQNRLETEP